MTDHLAVLAPSFYKRHRFPAEVISHAVWLYFRFPLSFRHVEDMLAARGIEVSFQTVAEWARKFGGAYARRIQRMSKGRFADKWHLDELVVAIKGKKHWLWRAVDADDPNAPSAHLRRRYRSTRSSKPGAIPRLPSDC